MKILKFDESFLFEVNPDTFEKNLVAAGPTGFTTLCIYARTLISQDKTLSQKEKEAIYSRLQKASSENSGASPHEGSYLLSQLGVDIRSMGEKSDGWDKPLLVDSLTFHMDNAEPGDTHRPGGKVRVIDCGNGLSLQLENTDVNGRAHGFSEVLVESRGSEGPDSPAQMCLLAYTFDPYSGYGSDLPGKGVSEEPAARMHIMPEQIYGVEVMKEDGVMKENSEAVPGTCPG